MTHSHTHSHAEGDNHCHTHGDGHCGSCESGDCKNETVALTYTLQHNEHHAAELDQMADNLKKLNMMQLRRRSKRQLQIFRKAI